jgi:NitT/TauT family transport system substrate-binding protein
MRKGGMLLAMAAVALLASGAQAADKVLFQANWLIQGENAYMVAGREQGFYRAEGIELDLTRGFGSGDTLKKVVSGAATIGTADIGVMMLARVREGLPVKCIAAEYTSSPQSFWVLADGPVRSIADLAGKRVGMTAGSSLAVYFPLVAAANKLEPSAVTFVNMEASALLPVLLAGQIDAMPGFATVFALRNEEANAQGKALRAFPFADHGVQVYGECQLVTEATIKSSPDLLRRYLRATHKALAWSRDNPAETARIMAAAYPELKEERVIANHKAFMTYVFNDLSARTGVGGFDRDQLQRTFDAVKTAQKVDAAPDVTSFVDTSFLPPG